MDTLQNFIDGRWTDAPERSPAINPATGQQIAWLPKSDRTIAREAIAAAKQARAGWAKTSVWKRAEMCVAIATSIDERRAQIARTLSQEQGKPLAQATGEVAKAADGFRLAGELVRQMKGETLPAEDPTKLVMTLRQPRGVYAVITPWNYPVNIPVEYLGPGLATGNTIVWVPAPTTSMAAVELMRAIEAAGLPAGVLNLVIGEGPVVGDEIVSHPDTAGIGFTGSAVTGRRIAERGAGKPMLLELGGNGPLLVFEDADLKRAATAAANGAFSNAGQICAATGRVLAHESVAEELAERIAGHARNYILGDPLHQGVTMGPLNNPKVAAKVREHVDEAVAAGANVVTGGESRPDLGSELFFEPTVLTGVTREMRINREETFGPVTPILSFRDDEEAMSLALDSEYGLSVGVFTRDMDRALRFAEAIPAGIVNINDSSTYWEIHLPFGGGSGTRSGVGRLGGRLTLEAMTEIKMITVTRDMKDAGMTDLSELETTPEVGDEKLGPAGAATLIADFVDVLIPGERLWPSASAVGVQGLLALRLMEERGKNALPTLVKAIETAGGPLGPLDEPARVAVVQRLEVAEPDLFGWVRDATYIAYYENPFVAEAVVLSGHPYELRPHIKGYPVRRFDLARDAPRHGRGRYTKTSDVRRVDISALDLESNRTQAWGLKR